MNTTAIRHKRAQVYAAELTPAQAETFALQRAGVTWFYNQAAESQLARYRQGGKEKAASSRRRTNVETYMSLAYAVTQARQAGWTFQHRGAEHLISEVPAVMLHGALRQLAASWVRHLAMRKENRESSPPRFRSVHRAGGLYWQTQHRSGKCPLSGIVTVTKLGRAMITVPGGIGPVRIRYHRELPADTLVGFAGLKIDDVGRYWALVQYETSQVRQAATSGVVGVDRGVAVTVATSDGEVYSVPGLSPGQDARRVRLQRNMARKRRLNPCSHDIWVTAAGRSRLVRGNCPPPGAPDHDCDCWKHSNRYQRDKLAFLKLAQREARQRTNGAHLASRALANKYATVVMEDLNISGMTASAKGTEETPGSNVRAKAGLNREILAGNWYELQQFVAYKAELVTVSARYTSQTCPACGLVTSANRPSQAVFRCVGCGLSGHADIIAAGNIKDRFTAVAQTAEAREISEPVRVEPVNSHNSISSTQDVAQSSPVGSLVPPEWGLGPPRQRKPRPRNRRVSRKAT